MRVGLQRAIACVALALAGCATGPIAVDSAASRAAIAPGPDVPFDLSGRVSAKRGNEGISAGYRWQHDPPRDEVLFTTPLGAAAARLEGDAAGARLEFADGNVRGATDIEALAEQALGAPLPLRGLVWWIRAKPRPGSAFHQESDEAGRLGVLHQDGWQIVFAYADAGSPRRLVLTREDVEVRLSIDAAP